MKRMSLKLAPIVTALLLGCSSKDKSTDTMAETAPTDTMEEEAAPTDTSDEAAPTDTMDEGLDTAEPDGAVVVSGSVQKGPFIIGSEIQVSMLDGVTGDATGEVFHTTTRSYLGEYELTLPRASMVEVVGSGYYFNELENRTSAAFLTLHALAEITEEGEQNIYANVLTQVTYLRAARLIEEGVEFHEAIQQAEYEFMSRLSAVLIPPAAPGAGSSMNMIGGDTGDNAYLLALSCVLLQAAVDDVEDGEGVETNTEAALQSILNVAALELEETGMFHADKWVHGAHNLNTQTCFRNMKTFVRDEGSLDEALAVPNIARILDSDGDGIVDMMDDDVDGDGFTEADGDCDDSDASMYPGNEESCDGLDNNCDGERDEGFSRVSYWADMDEDGHGNPDEEYQICDSISVDSSDESEGGEPSAFDAEELLGISLVGGFESMEDYVARMLSSMGIPGEEGELYEAIVESLELEYAEAYTAYTHDCDDTNADVNPDATEVCDGIDNDCDDSIDEDAEGGVDAYLDVDEDGLYSTEATTVCDDTIAYTLTSPLDDETPRDCDDSDPDGTNTYTDADCDGVVTDDDCDDNDSISTFIAADADCDGVVNNTDEDGDGVADYCGFSWDTDLEDESTTVEDATFNDCNDCDDSDPSIGSSDDDADCDGVATDDDCDDTDATVGNTGTTRSIESPDGTVTIVDGDCDGVLTEDDCDDADPDVIGMGDDADCDGARFYEDCDDTDPSSTLVADDADCDGVLTADDCNDSNAASTTLATDADCDGVLTDDDCNDTDAASTHVAEDADCDGARSYEDCDDEDPTSSLLADDADCDGVLTADDCNDSSATSTTHATDADCDGVLTADDCDDNDPGSTTVATDADCDGTLTIHDCDDSEAALNDHDADGDGQSTCEHDCDDGDHYIYSGAVEHCDGIDSDCDSDLVDEFDDFDGDGIPECESCEDADGDGVSTCDDDCDDSDASLGTIHNDADCDGSITEDDCDDDDASVGDESNDHDCDGVVTADDCDDYYASFGDSAFDADCDGTVTEEDCDEISPLAAYSTTIATDADCDGIVTADDCDDNDPTSTRVTIDADCDGVLTADDCDDTDSDSTTVATDADCDGTVTEEDCDEVSPLAAYSTTVATDADCDGYPTADDCDDDDPESTAVWTDGDCDGVITAYDCDDDDPDSTTIDIDADCDGAVVGVIGVHNDCDDDDPSLGSSGEDADCDGVLTADDCDDEDADSTTVATDADCDGFPADGGLSWPFFDDDCDDSDASINPYADELCDGIDNDCDDSIDEDAVDATTFYRDSDNDGYGDDDITTTGCSAPSGYVASGGDCNDSNRRVNPGVIYDRPGDGLDNDCDGEIDEGF